MFKIGIMEESIKLHFMDKQISPGSNRLQDTLVLKTTHWLWCLTVFHCVFHCVFSYLSNTSHDCLCACVKMPQVLFLVVSASW